ncbi:hypothetical protein P153DRAFT_382174 [Dothidotthia symphoricarpi CBS 119687]|uniref:F-box domain-containing protein n=1 Tax=Dothidotthia symphoricarpi CBS 119687 TaxID=1392245 RepID=A0A6A6AKS3_9PLEO|nr:uncharacterized protein P153DRAFT_382174 [Dothidotthia symphoricarpi CBS 119687]KAF2132549.1 hypothetical protein P153DRAFT_382174 [Dothidotthia symphoricarpi CBS 119687]
MVPLSIFAPLQQLGSAYETSMVTPPPKIINETPKDTTTDAFHATRLKIAQRNQHDSPLLGLPAELRNKIYGYVLCGKTIAFELFRTVPGFDENNFNLLRTCRQIHAEAQLLPYAKNTFLIGDRSQFKQWLQQRTALQIDAISTIHLRFTLGINNSSADYRWRLNRTHIFTKTDKLEMAFLEIPNLRKIMIVARMMVDPDWKRMNPITSRPDAEDVLRCIEVQSKPVEAANPGVRIVVEKTEHREEVEFGSSYENVRDRWAYTKAN